MKTALTALILSASLATASLVTVAAPGMGPDHEGARDPAAMLEKMTRRLDLNEDQQAQIADIMEQSAAERDQDRNRKREVREELDALSSQYDEAQAQSLSTELGEITARQSLERVSTMAQINAVLDDEQRAQLAQHREKRKEKRGQWKGDRAAR